MENAVSLLGHGYQKHILCTIERISFFEAASKYTDTSSIQQFISQISRQMKAALSSIHHTQSYHKHNRLIISISNLPKEAMISCFCPFATSTPSHPMSPSNRKPRLTN